jgi:hypothetical protein
MFLMTSTYSNQETWISSEHLSQIVQNLTKRNLTIKIQDLRDYCKQCWIEIGEKRRYQVPSQGRAEILASDKLADLMHLKSVRFFQEGANAPSVFLAFHFEETPLVGILKVGRSGNTRGFHNSVVSNLFEAIVEAITLSYYRDLVTPGKVYFYKPGSSLPHHRSLSPKLGGFRKLPRPQMMPLSEPKLYDFREWHYAQERARQSVTGHMRWFEKGFRADWEKQQQARKAGVELPLGYTWVIEHDRGSSESDRLILNGTDLVEHIFFAPPERASAELNSLL